MIVSAIVAVDNNNGIGKNNRLLWHLPKDLRFFRETTSGHAVIMGRKTFESLGKPLKNRSNYVISTQKDYTAEGATVYKSIAEALEKIKAAKETECFILGGGQIYSQSLQLCDRVYLTKVNAHLDADVFFPGLDRSEWQETWQESHTSDEKHTYDFSFHRYERKKKP
jgi:dihydrofolate reductase